MRAISDKGKIAKDYLKKYPDKPTKTLARLLAKEHSEYFKTIRGAETMIRYYRGNSGKMARVSLLDKTHVRPNQPAGYVTKIPKTKYKDWLPFDINHKKNLILADIHVPYHDTKAVTAALRFGDEYEPDSIILNGDCLDCFSVSRFLKNPKERDFPGEVIAMRQFLDHLRERFPKAAIYYKLGNHEERYEHFLWMRSEELIGLPDFELKNILRLDDCNVQVIEEQRIINLGQLPILHGHEYMRGVFSPVNPARGYFLKGLHSCLGSHLHRSSDHTETTLVGKIIVTWSTGALCGLHPEYARLNKWNHGFATVELKADNSYHVSNYRILDGKLIN